MRKTAWLTDRKLLTGMGVGLAVTGVLRLFIYGPNLLIYVLNLPLFHPLSREKAAM